MGSLKFRVLLDTEQDTEIFRDILIGETHNLEQFYQSIMSAFGFQGDQMASFYLSNENWDKGREVSLMDMSFGESQEEEGTLVMSETKMEEIVETEDQKMILVYDFMRMWIFLIELIGREEKEVAEPEVALMVGETPDEESREMDLGDLEDEEGEESDDLFDDFEDGYDDDDFQSYDDYEY
ncbi:MAG: hypothetical protein EP338_07015 [Bacteroidetes bacterium]|nr:MAG: hypothetical protein EP338_07015 [Bacteroidota bacterium]